MDSLRGCCTAIHNAGCRPCNDCIDMDCNQRNAPRAPVWDLYWQCAVYARLARDRQRSVYTWKAVLRADGSIPSCRRPPCPCCWCRNEAHSIQCRCLRRSPWCIEVGVDIPPTGVVMQLNVFDRIWNQKEDEIQKILFSRLFLPLRCRFVYGDPYPIDCFPDSLPENLIHAKHVNKNNCNIVL